MLKRLTWLSIALIPTLTFAFDSGYKSSPRGNISNDSSSSLRFPFSECEKLGLKNTDMENCLKVSFPTKSKEFFTVFKPDHYNKNDFERLIKGGKYKEFENKYATQYYSQLNYKWQIPTEEQLNALYFLAKDGKLYSGSANDYASGHFLVKNGGNYKVIDILDAKGEIKIPNLVTSDLQGTTKKPDKLPANPFKMYVENKSVSNNGVYAVKLAKGSVDISVTGGNSGGIQFSFWYSAKNLYSSFSSLKNLGNNKAKLSFNGPGLIWISVLNKATNKRKEAREWLKIRIDLEGVNVGGYYYRLFNTPQDWHGANKTCSSNGLKLPSGSQLLSLPSNKFSGVYWGSDASNGNHILVRPGKRSEGYWRDQWYPVICVDPRKFKEH